MQENFQPTKAMNDYQNTQFVQSGPVVSTQPQNKKVNNFGLAVAIVIIVLLIGLALMGVFLLKQNQQTYNNCKIVRNDTPQTVDNHASEVAENITINEVNETKEEMIPESDLLTYKNDIFSFKVDYPKSYQPVDRLQLDNKQWKPDNDLEFIDITATQEPHISVRLDYDGYGPQFPLEIWELGFDKSTGKLKVVSKEVQDKNFIKEATGQEITSVLIVAGTERTIFSDKERSLNFILRYDGMKNQKIETQFENLIESFRLVQ